MVNKLSDFMNRIKYTLTMKHADVVLEENADFIVNPSNTELMLGSGVSLSFSRHCGKGLQSDMNELLADINSTGYKLKKGDVIPTGSGHANNFKHALHVVIMDYSPGTHYEDKYPELPDIHRSLENIEKVIIEFSKLHNKQNIKLVMPLIGCGYGNLDNADVIQLYVEFFKSDDSNKNINCDVIICTHSQWEANFLIKYIDGTYERMLKLIDGD